MALQLNNLVIFDSTTKSIKTAGGSSDQFFLEASVDFQGSISVNQYTTSPFKIGGAYPIVNSTNTTGSAEASGVVFIVESESDAASISNTVVASDTFEVGTDATSFFSAGDIILVSGQENPENNGLYVVSSVTTAPDEVIIDNTPGSSIFLSEIPVNGVTGGQLQKVTISVLNYTSAGVLQTATGSAAPLSFSAVGGGGGGGGDLQDAYDAGATISTDSGTGDVVISGTEALSITAAGGLDVDTTGAISLVADAASTFDVAGANLVLRTSGAGNVSVIGSGNASMQAFGEATLTGASVNITANTFSPGTGITINSAAGFSADPITITAGSSGSISIESNIQELEAVTTLSLTGGTLGAGNQTALEGGFTITAAVNLSAGHIVSINSSGQVTKAIATSVAGARLVGAARLSATAAGPAIINTLQGGVYPVSFLAAPAGASMGSMVYLSTDATGGGGFATLTAPTASGTVVYELGVLAFANGSLTEPPVVWSPRFVIVN